MSDALGEILKKPDVVSKFAGMGTDIWYAPPAEFAPFVKADIPVWQAHANTAGIAPQ